MKTPRTSKKKLPSLAVGFAAEARQILDLPIDDRTSALGGYGRDGEVIYERHPSGCPSVLVDSRPGATATYMSNGSIGFVVKAEGGMDIRVLDGSFDSVEKRQINAPSNNVWLDVQSAKSRHIASLINPAANVNARPHAIKVVKLGDPDRSMWYCATFRLAPGVAYQTAVKFSLTTTKAGPTLLRRIFVRNIGSKALRGNLWTAFTLHGTQKFVYNKELWYDSGLPLNPCEIVVSCTVPYTDMVQIKRFSSHAENARPMEATADYATFVGDTAADIQLPQAVLAGHMLKGGAGDRLSRFSTAAVAANRFALSLPASKSASIQQSLLYVTDEPTIREYARRASFSIPTYQAMSKTFAAAGGYLLKATPAARQITGRIGEAGASAAHPPFAMELPARRRISHYANSLWTGVQELYEKCRAHGAKLANGIELGTRDRAQDMWPKMKQDPGLVRADLVHALGLMYVTSDSFTPTNGRLSIVQKLHGMFPRQYPSRWDDRSEVVMCDNRPYTDSPLWLINAVNMYLRETGDLSILSEEVTSVHLTDPEHPVTSGIVGCDRRYKLVEVIREIFACFARHAADSPYGLCQIMYGDWCDPVDMFGTNPAGDPATRGHGRGAGVRLSAHVFHCLVESIDTLEAPRVSAYLGERGILPDLAAWKALADSIRQNAVKWAWEEAPGMHAGFVSYLHELRADGGVPNYSAGETGYTLGSMRKGRDFDGLPRRDLTTNAYGLNMLATQRDYLAPVDGRERLIDALLATTDKLFYRDKLGLLLYTTPIPNNDNARRLVGRMGIIPSGVAENGEYHHAQVMMHLFRVRLAGDAGGLRAGLVDTAWDQFKPMLSAMRDESLAGPFEMPATSYASDPDDPHFGKGMYFGLSGSTDWIIELFQSVSGVELALHDDRGPAVRITPRLPREIEQTLTFRRLIHAALPDGGYRLIPLTVDIRREGTGKKSLGTQIRINGRAVEVPEIANLDSVEKVKVEIVHRFGK